MEKTDPNMLQEPSEHSAAKPGDGIIIGPNETPTTAHYGRCRSCSCSGFVMKNQYDSGWCKCGHAFAVHER